MRLVNLKKVKTDSSLLTIVIILIFIGIIMVFSSSAIFAYDKYESSYYFFKKQIFWILLGSLTLIFLKNFNYENFRNLARPLFVVSVIILCFVFVPYIGVTIKGARRWISVFRFTFEPSELLKLTFVIYMAESIARKSESLKYFTSGILPYLVIVIVLSVILLLQPDLGSIAMITLLGFVILFIGGLKLRYVLLTFVFSLPLWYFLVTHAVYRHKRILAFLNPWKDPQGTSFQIIQSFVAVGSGGIFGRGLGRGTQKLFYLPESHTDFIFAIIGEELGLIGTSVVLLLFCLIILKGIKLSLQVEDTFGKLLAVGITSYIGASAFVNMSVVTGMLPTKGLTLPFISYGGSSLLINMAAIGILLNISSKAKDEKNYY